MLYAAHLSQKVEEFDCLIEDTCRKYRKDRLVQKCHILRECLQLGNYSRYFQLSADINAESGILDRTVRPAGEDAPDFYHLPFLFWECLNMV